MNDRVYKQEGTTGMYQSMLWALSVARFGRTSWTKESWGQFYVFFKNNYLGILWDESCFERVARAILSGAKNGIPSEWLSKWREVDRELTEKVRASSEIDLAKLSISELRTLYDRIFAVNQKMWDLLIFIDTFDSGTDQRAIEKIAAAHGFADDEVQILIAPASPSFVAEWDIAIEKLDNGEHSRENVKRIFFWHATDYFSFGHMTDDFIDAALARGHSSEFDSQEELRESILAAHGITANPLQFFQDLTLWRDIRKRLNYTSLYGLLRILRELLERYAMDAALANGLLPQQINELCTGTLQEGTLRKQFFEGTFLSTTPEGEMTFIFGPDASDAWNELNKSQTTFGAELRGTPASRGKATGRVRVVQEANSEQGLAMQNGEVLVTSMTRPEFLPLMRKACAIVTNEGGITSHAAIVSRELKKPCVIGTKSATQVFKTGDMVEVDAEKGIVRKL